MRYYRIRCPKFVAYIETDLEDIITEAKSDDHIGLHLDEFLSKVRKLGETWVYRIR